MRYEDRMIRSGYDGKRCLVHARCCEASGLLVATAQYLNVEGCDLFSGLLSSTSTDGGQTWSDFYPEANLAPIERGDRITVGCDATPMYHKSSERILLLGHTATYMVGQMKPTSDRRYTFYSFYDRNARAFSKMRFLEMPSGFENCGNGSGQSVELDNGELLIPVYYKHANASFYCSTVLRCVLVGEQLQLLEIGGELTIPVGRGLYEPSVICHNGVYYITLRNDYCALVAKSKDGLHYTDLRPWMWSDGALLDSYNTQQHWASVGGELYLIYTRRGAENDHVFRHRAPLFAARVENMRLLRESEQAIVPERGARLGNFGVSTYRESGAIVMAAEWMQPIGCERYGSDNAIFLVELRP